MTEEEAEMRWTNESTNSKDLGIITDQHGPPKRPLRIRVKVADKVNFSNAYSRKRKSVLQDMGIKNASDDDVHRLAKRAMANHDKAGSLTEDLDLQEIGQGMVTGGAGQAFNGFNLNVQDVRKLVPDEASDEDDEEDGASKAAAEEDGIVDGCKTGGGKPGKTPWFDRDRSINAATKQCKTNVKTTVDKHEKITKELLAAIKDLSCMYMCHHSNELIFRRRLCHWCSAIIRIRHSQFTA